VNNHFAPKGYGRFENLGFLTWEVTPQKKRRVFPWFGFSGNHSTPNSLN